jgi:hypothetical protein
MTSWAKMNPESWVLPQRPRVGGQSLWLRDEAIREMVALRAQGKALRAIAAAQARGHQISHEGVAGVLRASGV